MNNMKKTVQIVTIPLNKVGWDKGDLVIQHGDKVYWHLTRLGSGTVTEYVDAQAQQLLVLSDDERFTGDKYIGKGFAGKNIFTWHESQKEIYKNEKGKIIASYPNIPNTLPLSKETIQQWIDNGTPRKGNVDLGKFYTGNYIHKCKTCDKEYIADKRWYRCKECSEKEIIVDSQGNLILEFVETFSIPERKITVAPIVPTDEEIEEKAISEVDGKTESNIDSPLRKRLEQIYISGYIQALKDLGYEK